MTDMTVLQITGNPKDLASGQILNADPGSIWPAWFLAGNNVQTDSMPNGLLTRTQEVIRNMWENADAAYHAKRFDRLHLGQHDNGQPRTVRPPNTHWWEMSGRLLREEV